MGAWRDTDPRRSPAATSSAATVRACRPLIPGGPGPCMPPPGQREDTDTRRRRKSENVGFGGEAGPSMPPAAA